MGEPIRVLHVLTSMSGGGVDMFLMNMYRNIDRTKVQFDFLLCSDDNIYADELAALGSRIYQVPKYTNHLLSNRYQTRHLLHEHPYPIIHVHANALMNMAPIQEAARAAIPVRIMHSHSTSLKYKPLRLLHDWNKLRLHRWCNCRVACSTAAGEWMFREPFLEIRNAIDLEQFRFNSSVRGQVRLEWGVRPDTLVLGHVGRFLPVKNHSFLLKVLHTAVSMGRDVMLVLVGSGPLMDDVRASARTLGLEDRVRLLGIRPDVSRLLNGMDAFALPSHYEGLGIAAIEAQANGLYTICSDAVPRETIVTDHAERLPTVDPVLWAERILAARREPLSDVDRLTRGGYNIQREALRLQELYLEQLKQHIFCHE